MIKLDKEYSDYTDETDVDAYPAGKAVDATTEESIDGTPYLKKWMNNIHGAFTALWVKAFGSVEGMSGKPDSAAHSDVLLAVEKLIELPLAAHRDTRGIDAHGATIAATPGQIVTRDQVGRAKVAAPTASDDIARKEEVDAEAEARISAVTAEEIARISSDTWLLEKISTEETARENADTTEANTRAAADNTLQHNINTEASTRTGADGTLQHNINVANNARLSADTALSTRITSNDTDIHNLFVEIDRLQEYRSWETNTGKTWTGGQVIYRRCWSGHLSNGTALFNIGTNRNVITATLTGYMSKYSINMNYDDGSYMCHPRYVKDTGIVYPRIGGDFGGIGHLVIEYY